MKDWIELREPGRVPERKGPFTTPTMLKGFLVELFKCRPAALVSVVTCDFAGPEFQDGPECLEMMDRRYRHLAKRHRESSAAAWRADKRGMG